MPIIRLTFPYPEWPLLRQTPAHLAQWGDCRFIINDEATVECDYWVIFESLPERSVAHCRSGRAIFITGEPPTFRRYEPAFLRQFTDVITCQARIRHPGVRLHLQGHPWFVGKSYDELTATTMVPKTRSLSVICSNKRFTAGHERRYAFCMKLKETFGDSIDLFGKGIRDFEDKWDTLAPYRYSVAIENCQCNDWLTEKLFDCYLAHTVPIYHGCPNVDRYFDPASLVRIDIRDMDSSRRAIERLLSDENEYDRRLPALARAKEKCLNRYNLFPLIVEHIRAAARGSTPAARSFDLLPETEFVGRGFRGCVVDPVLSRLSAIRNRLRRDV